MQVTAIPDAKTYGGVLTQQFGVPGGRTVVGEDSAVLTCCGQLENGVMMEGFVVVVPEKTLVP